VVHRVQHDSCRDRRKDSVTVDSHPAVATRWRVKTAITIVVYYVCPAVVRVRQAVPASEAISSVGALVRPFVVDNRGAVAAPEITSIIGPHVTIIEPVVASLMLEAAVVVAIEALMIVVELARRAPMIALTPATLPLPITMLGGSIAAVIPIEMRIRHHRGAAQNRKDGQDTCSAFHETLRFAVDWCVRGYSIAQFA
jgi:hypothetical protein